MRLFTGIVHQEADSAYGITFPDLPGCFAAADSFGDVIAAGAEAPALWFEDQPVSDPAPPTSVDAAGGTLVAIPCIQPT